MYFSSLQKYIVLQCFTRGGKVDREIFRAFYKKQDGEAAVKYQESIITKSLERVINKELMIGFGKRTPHRWFITHVKLTKKGREMAKQILQARQKKLPMKFGKK